MWSISTFGFTFPPHLIFFPFFFLIIIDFFLLLFAFFSFLFAHDYNHHLLLLKTDQIKRKTSAEVLIIDMYFLFL
jgi:hypothetical protein